MEEDAVRWSITEFGLIVERLFCVVFAGVFV